MFLSSNSFKLRIEKNIDINIRPEAKWSNYY